MGKGTAKHDETQVDQQIRLLLEAYLKFIEYRKASKSGALSSNLKLPSNTEIGQRIKKINEGFLNDPSIVERVDSLIQEKVFIEPSLRKGLAVNLANVNNSSLCESQENLSMRSARGDCNSRSSFRASSYKATPPQFKLKKQPVSKLKFDYLFSASQTMEAGVTGEPEKKMAFKENIRLMAMKKAQRSDSQKQSMATVFKQPVNLVLCEEDITDLPSQYGAGKSLGSNKKSEEKLSGENKITIKQSDIDEIMLNFGLVKGSPMKTMTEHSDQAEYQRDSENEAGSELYEQKSSQKKLIRHASLPRELIHEETDSIAPSIHNDLLYSHKEEVNSATTEGYFWNRQKKPSKFSLYKGS